MTRQTLTPGRWRGLLTTSSEAGIFTIMAFDQRGSYTQMLGEAFTYDQAASIKKEVIIALSPHTSAVLLDATYGVPAALALHRSSGLLMALEKTGYSGTATYRQTEFDPKWTVEKIKKAGAAAVKLLVYYHPGAGQLAEEIESLTRDVAQACHANDVPLFVEPVSYSLDASISKDSAIFAEQRPQIVRETAQRFNRTGADVLKLEFPVDASFDDDEQHWLAACEAISEAVDVPWVLLSAGVDFPIFERQVAVACRGGASGFLGGRAIWKECITMPPEDRRTFLATTGVERLQRLGEAAHAHGRPWTDFYQPFNAAENWFLHYD